MSFPVKHTPLFILHTWYLLCVFFGSFHKGLSFFYADRGKKKKKKGKNKNDRGYAERTRVFKISPQDHAHAEEKLALRDGLFYAKQRK